MIFISIQTHVLLLLLLLLAVGVAGTKQASLRGGRVGVKIPYTMVYKE
jgi:hypothetical protein